MMRDRKFKANQYLTDGESVIYIGEVRKPTWTPDNNYGTKDQSLIYCGTYPKELRTEGGALVIQKGFFREIHSLWLQEGYSLQHFKIINKSLLSEEVIESCNLKYER